MSSIDEQIRQAMAEGKFDDLPGKGKPLRLDENPYENPEWRMAYQVLRDGGFTLPWIETRNEIEAKLEAARQDLRRSWEYCQPAQAGQDAIETGTPGDGLEAEWQRAQDAFSQKLEAINKLIFSYNLEAPSPAFQMLPVSFERELEKVRGDQA